MKPPDIPICGSFPPGTPCPTPDNCLCNYERVERTSPFVGVVLLVIVLLSAVIVVSSVFIGLHLMTERALGADNEEPCLTQQQARAKYPGRWLYWHTINRCWDDKPGRRSAARPAVAPKRPVPVARTNGDSAARQIVLSREQQVFYPALMSGGGTDSEMLQPVAMTRWPLVIDVDDDVQRFIPWSTRVNFNRGE